ncbi:transposase [Agrobacterium tumefaciens]|uniref:IS3 family transposase n=1 Tax=Agrobacterium tumefaciens TaxID=358 RepID=UPI0015739EF8|nr:transposase [Agrobacterium tumefaciens]
MQNDRSCEKHLLLSIDSKGFDLGDTELVAIIEDIQDELPCYGYRCVTHELQRRGHLVNHKRVARVMRANGLGIKPRKRYVRTTDSTHDSPIYARDRP